MLARSGGVLPPGHQQPETAEIDASIGDADEAELDGLMCAWGLVLCASELAR